MRMWHDLETRITSNIGLGDTVDKMPRMSKTVEDLRKPPR